MNNEANAYRTAKTIAKQTGKRYRLMNDAGSLLDLLETTDKQKQKQAF